MCKPIPSTFAVYKPGIGITITRANIILLQQECAEAKQKAPSPRDVVMAFACTAEQNGKAFPESREFARRLYRAECLMNGWKAVTEAMKPVKKRKANKEVA